MTIYPTTHHELEEKPLKNAPKTVRCANFGALWKGIGEGWKAFFELKTSFFRSISGHSIIFQSPQPKVSSLHSFQS